MDSDGWRGDDLDRSTREDKRMVLLDDDDSDDLDWKPQDRRDMKADESEYGVFSFANIDGRNHQGC